MNIRRTTKQKQQKEEEKKKGKKKYAGSVLSRKDVTKIKTGPTENLMN